jgi:hypothetical protein
MFPKCWGQYRGAEIAKTVQRMATAWMTEGSSSSPGRITNFLLSKSFRPALGPTQPPIQSVRGASSLGIKRPGREADHSPTAITEVKKM